MIQEKREKITSKSICYKWISSFQILLQTYIISTIYYKLFRFTKKNFLLEKRYPDNWAPNKWMKSINLPSQNSFGQFFHQKWQNKWSWMGDINKITHIIIQVNLHFFSLSFLSFEKRWSVSLKLMRSKLLWSTKYWKNNLFEQYLCRTIDFGI